MPRGKFRSLEQRRATEFHQHVWRHNSFMGMAKLIERNADTIACAPSTNEATKELAIHIRDLASLLDSALRAERIDPK